MAKVNFTVSDEMIEFRAKNMNLPELTTLEFWRALMNHKYDKRFEIGGTYSVTETVISSNDRKEIVVFIIDKEREKGEAEIVLAKRDKEDSITILRAMIRFHYIHDGGAYDGMKKGFDMMVGPPRGCDRDDFMNTDSKDVELLKEAVKTVLTSPRFRLKSIYF